jgi:uncharacterized membrane protein YsdA (DUF1294 family)
MSVKASSQALGHRRSLKVTYSIAALVACTLGTLAFWLWLRWDVYWAWLLSTNVIAFIFYRYDKWRSTHSGGMRVPEVTLILVSLIGGFVGAALGMYMPERHKTRHVSFKLALIAGAAIQVGVIYFLYLR